MYMVLCLILLIFIVLVAVLAAARMTTHPHTRIGGAAYPIIHISGPSGAGKTTLGKRLAEQFGAAIAIKDTDDLLDECLHGRPWSAVGVGEIQRHINKFITEHNDRPIVITGLLSLLKRNSRHYSSIPATHKFYLDVDDGTVVRQKCTRVFGTLASGLQMHNNAEFLRQARQAIKQNCDARAIVAQNAAWAAHHRAANYTFADADQIFAAVSVVLTGVV